MGRYSTWKERVLGFMVMAMGSVKVYAEALESELETDRQYRSRVFEIELQLDQSSATTVSRLHPPLPTIRHWNQRAASTLTHTTATVATAKRTPTITAVF